MIPVNFKTMKFEVKDAKNPKGRQRNNAQRVD